MTALPDYLSLLRKYASEKADVPIKNSDAEHAALALQVLFEEAKSRVCLLTGSLYDGVYSKPGLVDAALNFLKKNDGCTLDVAFEGANTSQEIESKQLLMRIKSDSNLAPKLRVWDVHDKVLDPRSHFAVADGKSFRFEVDHEKKAAICNFGDLKSAQKLQNFFDSLVALHPRLA